MSDAKEIAAQHWEYIKALLERHDIPEKEIAMIGFHYQTAFIHGWKHGCEAMDGKG